MESPDQPSLWQLCPLHQSQPGAAHPEHLEWLQEDCQRHGGEVGGRGKGHGGPHDDKGNPQKDN